MSRPIALSILLVVEVVRRKDLLGLDYEYIQILAFDTFRVGECACRMTSLLEYSRERVLTYLDLPSCQ
jgi:hypothetical protein